MPHSSSRPRRAHMPLCSSHTQAILACGSNLKLLTLSSQSSTIAAPCMTAPSVVHRPMENLRTCRGASSVLKSHVTRHSMSTCTRHKQPGRRHAHSWVRKRSSQTAQAPRQPRQRAASKQPLQSRDPAVLASRRHTGAHTSKAKYVPSVWHTCITLMKSLAEGVAMPST